MPCRFDFALSFAGPCRPVARDLAECLRGFGLRVFFDEDYQHELLGLDGATYLRKIYSLESKFCVIFITEDYDRRTWTQLEREAIQGREIRGETGVLLPVVVDGHKPFWLPETRIYFDLSQRNIFDLAALLYKKAVPSGQMFTPIGKETVEGRKALVRFLPNRDAFLIAPTGAFDDPPRAARLLRIAGTELSLTSLPIKSRFADVVCCGNDCIAIYVDPGGPPRVVNFVSLQTGAVLGRCAAFPAFDVSDIWKLASHPNRPLVVLCSGYGRILIVGSEPVQEVASFSVKTESYNPHACFLGSEQICILVDGEAVTYTISGQYIKRIDLGEECLSATTGPFANSLIVGLLNSIVCLDLASGKIIWKRDAPATGVYDLVPNPNSSVVAAITGFPFGSSRMILLNGFDGREVVCPLPQLALFHSCAFSARGELLVAAEQGASASPHTPVLYGYRMIAGSDPTHI